MNPLAHTKAVSRRAFVVQAATGFAGIAVASGLCEADLSAFQKHVAQPQTSSKTVMKPRISVITIGVDDLERSLRFYRDGLGLKTDGIIGQEFEYGAVVD